jgi:hypothetical protein
VVSASNDFDVVIPEPIYEPMFSVDAPGPEAGQFTAERLGLADPSISVTHDVGDQVIDPFDQLSIRVAEIL